MDVEYAEDIQIRDPLRASSSIRSALLKSKRGTGNLSFVYSPKVDRDWIVASDLELLHFVRLEGDEEVESYDLDPQRIVAFLDKEGYVGSKPDAIVRYRSGRVGLVEVKYAKDLEDDVRAQFQIAAQKKAADAVHASWCTFGEEDVHPHERWLQDWLDIVVTMSELRLQSLEYEKKEVLRLATARKPTDLRKLANSVDSEWIAVFTAVFRLVQSGELACDLRDRPLSWATMVWRSGKRP